MEPILERIVASFVSPDEARLRILSDDEVRTMLERVDVARLAARGVFLDPFDVGPKWKRRKYKVPPRPVWPEGADPFRIGPTPDRTEAADELIEWAESDYRLYVTSLAEHDTAAAGVSVRDDPFRVSVNRRPTDGDLGPFAVTVKQ